LVFEGRGGELGTSLSYCAPGGKTWLSFAIHSITRSFDCPTRGKNLLAGQVALAGGGMVVTTIVL